MSLPSGAFTQAMAERPYDRMTLAELEEARAKAREHIETTRAATGRSSRAIQMVVDALSAEIARRA